MQQILPPDYQGKDYFQKRDEEIERETVLNSTVMDPIAHCHSMPKSLQNEAPGDDDIVQALQTKIVERTKRPNDQYREGKATTLSCQLLLLVCTAFTSLHLRTITCTSHTTTTLVAAFALFGSPSGGIKRAYFRDRVRRLGIVAPDAQLNRLFRKLDVLRKLRCGCASEGVGAITTHADTHVM